MAEYVNERGFYNGIQWEPDKCVSVDDKYLAKKITQYNIESIYETLLTQGEEASLTDWLTHWLN